MYRRTLFQTLPVAGLGLLLAFVLNAWIPASAASAATQLPAPRVDATPAATPGYQTAVLAGGCFWGVESVFEHVKGVRKVVAGYAGGSARTAHYDDVSDGDTGHAESVQIQFDPRQISYGKLLQVFFSVALDPTELNRQGPDSGTQYRSVIFYGNPQQKQIATAYIAQLTAARSFPRPIVTQVVPLQPFYPAEAYHQNYAHLHPDNPYIVYNDAPKVANLKQLFPGLYQPEQELVQVQLH